MVFKAKYDKGALVTLITSPLLLTVTMSLINGYSIRKFIIMLLLVCLIGSFFILAIVSVKYIFADDELIICILGMNRKVLYRNIDRTIICRAPWKVESPSLHQIHIYGKGKRLATISVDDIDKFEIVLKNKCKN